MDIDCERSAEDTALDGQHGSPLVEKADSQGSFCFLFHKY